MTKIIRVTKSSYMHKAFMLVAEIPSTTEEIAAELDMKMKNAAVLLEDLRTRGMALLKDYGNCGMRVWVPANDIEVVAVDRSYWAQQRRQRMAEIAAAQRVPVQLSLFADGCLFC